MRKQIFTLLVLTTIFASKNFAQLPPVLNSYSYVPWAYSMDFTFNYTSNDTGTVLVHVFCEQGTGNVTFDNNYTVRADTNSATLHLSPLYFCSSYQLSVDFQNAHAYSQVYSHLFSFNTLCVSTGIASVSSDNFSTVVLNQAIELRSSELPQHAIAEIYDVTGRRVATTPVVGNTQQIPLNEGTGMYLLRILDNDKLLYTTRFVTN